MSEATVYCDPMDADARADSTVPFFWNGRLLQARPGDTLAIALWRNGIRALSASRKRHRPLGAGGPVVLGALVTVDGVPHVHADRIEVMLLNVATGALRVLPGLRANAANGDPLDWMPDGKHLLVRAVPASRRDGGGCGWGQLL